MKGPPTSPPTTTTPRRQLPPTPPSAPPVTRECACGVCHDDCAYANCDKNTNKECCKCINKFPSCFPAAASVSLENGKLVKMSELQTGDRVQTGEHRGSALKKL